MRASKKEYQEKTGEASDIQALRKLGLIKKMNDAEYPTHALVLFSDDDLRRSVFHFAKVECARFNGTTSDEFIDQWGNGLKLIADELKEYPQIGFRWRELGLSFQVQFVKLDYVKERELEQVGSKSFQFSPIIVHRNTLKA